MKVRILKDHESGLKAGAVSNPNDAVAKKLIENGIAEEVKTKAQPKKPVVKKTEGK